MRTKRENLSVADLRVLVFNLLVARQMARAERTRQAESEV